MRIEPPFALVAPECSCPIARFSEIGLFFAWSLPGGQRVPVVQAGLSHKVCVGWVFAIRSKTRYRRRH
jgi:hypothetical protein